MAVVALVAVSSAAVRHIGLEPLAEEPAKASDPAAAGGPEVSPA
jgi:hypothetical protein